MICSTFGDIQLCARKPTLLTYCKALSLKGIVVFLPKKLSLLGLLAKIMCSICSCQLNIWHARHSLAPILNWFLTSDYGNEACFSLVTDCPGFALLPGTVHSPMMPCECEDIISSRGTSAQLILHILQRMLFIGNLKNCAVFIAFLKSAFDFASGGGSPKHVALLDAVLYAFESFFFPFSLSLSLSLSYVHIAHFMCVKQIKINIDVFTWKKCL